MFTLEELHLLMNSDAHNPKCDDMAAEMQKLLVANGYNADKNPMVWVALLYLVVAIGVRHMPFMSTPTAMFVFHKLWFLLAVKEMQEESENSANKDKNRAAKAKYEAEAAEFLKNVDAPVVS